MGTRRIYPEDQMSTCPSPDFSEARDLIERLLRLRSTLEGPRAVEALREALRKAEGRWALYFLLLADADLVREVLPELIVAGLCHRDALLVRGIVGRLPRSVLQSELPPVIEVRLADADDDEFRRLAELLDHLGLDAELAHLVAVARQSEDPDIREVAESFEEW